MVPPRNNERDSSHCCVAIANARVVTARKRPLTRSAGSPITTAATTPDHAADEDAEPERDAGGVQRGGRERAEADEPELAERQLAGPAGRAR